VTGKRLQGSGTLVVVMTGSECTGKTTLARSLARRYGADWLPEAARLEADRKGAPLEAQDVEPIALRHLEAESAALLQSPRLLLLDTDLVSTVVYARDYYGGCPEWIVEAARERRGHLYLLHHTDVPWIADGVQRDRPNDRARMHDLFVRTLAEFGARVIDVRGGWEEREAHAGRAIDAILGTARA